MTSILPKSFVLDNKYTILLFIKKSSNAEIYRVKNNDGEIYLLKLILCSKLHRTAFDSEGNLLEIEFLKRCNHPNIAGYQDSGEAVVKGKKYIYLVQDFIAGENLMERMFREPVSTTYDIKHILSDVLNGLSYLHSLPEPIIHNEITPQNIMLDLSGNIPQAKIIDFGHARSFLQSSKRYNREGLNLNYVASESIMAGIFSPQSELFTVGVVMYQMLFGMLPWNISDIELMHTNYEKLLEQHEKPLVFPDVANSIVDFDESALHIIRKALHPDSEQRFQSAHEFLQALNGKIEIADAGVRPQEKKIQIKKKSGGGFFAIAGMSELKKLLQTDVIDIIRNPEEYQKHGLGLPNGLLLYGPPGCGKTFFAERFAEEAGYSFRKVIASDLASIYVHGTQEKIGKIFEEARQNAPSILYFDEFDAMTRDRDNTSHSYGSEVNEFLSQLDNIGDSGVFVIGSTNKPQLIDKAVLRAGRLEKHFYIPPPDFEARRAMFEIYLKERPLDFGIDYEKLATLTENYVSGDIKLIVDEASRKTIREKSKRITMETLEFVIHHQKPTISLDILKKFEKIRDEMQGVQHDRRKVGFI